jgi:hypothetical protein
VIDSCSDIYNSLFGERREQDRRSLYLHFFGEPDDSICPLKLIIRLHRFPSDSLLTRYVPQVYTSPLSDSATVAESLQATLTIVIPARPSTRPASNSSPSLPRAF